MKKPGLGIIANGLYLLAIYFFVLIFQFTLSEKQVVWAYGIMFACFLCDAVLMCFVSGWKALTWLKSIIAFCIWHLVLAGFVRLVMGFLSENYEGSLKLENTISLLLIALSFVVLILPHFKVKFNSKPVNPEFKPSHANIMFTATFKSMRGLMILFSVLGLIVIFFSFFTKSLLIIVYGIFPIVLLLIIKLRYKVTVNDNEITSTGFFQTKRINLSEITGSSWMHQKGYPYNRLYGLYVYEFRTSDKKMRINFIYFPKECMKTILEIVSKQKKGNKQKKHLGHQFERKNQT